MPEAVAKETLSLADVFHAAARSKYFFGVNQKIAAVVIEQAAGDRNLIVPKLLEYKAICGGCGTALPLTEVRCSDSEVFCDSCSA